MQKIDVHTHILPAEIPRWKEKFGYGGFITLDHHAPCCARMMRDDGHFFREIGDNCWSPERRIEECDAHGVDVQVLSTVPVMFNYWAKPADALETSMFLNDGIAQIVGDHPARFEGLGTVPLQDAKLAVRELDRCKSLGLKGVQIGSNIDRKNLNEPEFFDFFAACAESSMAIFVHPWEMMGEADMKKYWLPWLVGMPAETSRAICSMIFGGVFERLPALRVCFAHGGGSFPFTLGRIAHGFEVRPDLVAVDNDVDPRAYLGRFWVDSLVHDADMLRFLVKLFGPEKVCLGTDYPFPLGELEPGRVIAESAFQDDVESLLLNGAARTWLG